MKIDIRARESFVNRHNGPSSEETREMLQAIGVSQLDDLIEETIPASILSAQPLAIPEGQSEYNYIKSLRKMAAQNTVNISFIGQGYYDCVVPPVIQRNVLENPGWYTAYTPYQAEIAQGRLEALINFQTLICDLTGMELANASLLDEATAAAEAMSMLFHSRKGTKKKACRFLVDQHIFPQTLEVLKTRALPIGVQLDVVDIASFELNDSEVFGMYIQFPNNDGVLVDWATKVNQAKENEIRVAVGTDLMALTLFTPPGDWGADVVVGTSQRFGVPLGFGGPHAAFFATREEYKRLIPGRIIGASMDTFGNPAYRMALQTREQHIKRERATSNICTAQVLLAVMSSMYAVYHGPEGLRAIAQRIHALTRATRTALEALGIQVEQGVVFDTLKITGVETATIRRESEARGLNFRYFEENAVGISFDQTHDHMSITQVIDVFSTYLKKEAPVIDNLVDTSISHLRRESDYLTHEVFNSYQAEHEMLRYIKRLENKDLSLVHSMISLGSCTMKLNATTEMLPVSWPEFASIHPFTPKDQVSGYKQLIHELEEWLCEITGFKAVSFEPNSGAQGEYTGLMVIRAYHESNGDAHRNITLIPSSAHGTNPASAVMAGMKVVIVACDEAGNIDLEDLQEKAEAHAHELASLMITYPSTHGVFEEGIREICDIIHSHGGQVYMDGANMNAQVGLTSPGLIGADVCHLNLHKTFCIPHGGGGPGMGPIGVASHLVDFLPGPDSGKYAVSAAPYGSASILPISHAYIALMGGDGLTAATKLAILNANYIARRLEDHYPVLYKGKNGRNAHELIVDCRQYKRVGIEVEDIAKRLMDYGYHAPTVSFPVPGTLMIEPTESETKRELDRFCEVMIAIRTEIAEIENGVADMTNNVLKNAPHTQAVVLSENWEYPYGREKAAYPMESLRTNKFWPSVSRIDSAYGDRNLMCSCIPVEAYASSLEPA